MKNRLHSIGHRFIYVFSYLQIDAERPSPLWVVVVIHSTYRLGVLALGRGLLAADITSYKEEGDCRSLFWEVRAEMSLVVVHISTWQ